MTSKILGAELRLHKMIENIGEATPMIRETTAKTSKTPTSTRGAAAKMKEMTADTNKAAARMN